MSSRDRRAVQFAQKDQTRHIGDAGTPPAKATAGTPTQEKNNVDARAFIGRGGRTHAEARALLHQVVDLGLDFKYRQSFADTPSPALLDAIATEPLPVEGQPLEQLLATLQNRYLPTMPNFATPAFAGFPDAGNSLAGTAGALLSELINVNMINAEFCARGATEMELALIRWLRELIGYTVDSSAPASALEVGGIPTVGGTMANFAAVLLARSRALPTVRETGTGVSATPLRVLLPEHIGHYTVSASLAWSGLGTQSAIFAPIKNYRYDLSKLGQLLADVRDRGEQIIMAVAYAGDSRTMTIDNLRAVAETVRQYFPAAWLHCDGCHGTSLLFSSRQRQRLDGLADFDSVMVDPHKVLNVPYTNSFLLVREPADVTGISTQSELILRQARSLGQVTPATGSRAFQSLRTWMLLKSSGVEGIGKLIDDRIAKAHAFAQLIDATPGLVRINDVSINSVMFVVDPGQTGAPFSPHTARASADATERVYQAILRDGTSYLHSFRIADTNNRLGLGIDHVTPVLRFMSGNPLMTLTDLKWLIKHCTELAEIHAGQ